MRITSQAARSVRCSWLLALAGYAAPAASGQAEAIRMRESRTQSAIELMGGFAERTGITSDRPQQRYLWTDSFADEALEWDRDGQYFHYLAMWIFALDRLGAVDPGYREKAIALVRDIHPAFVVPGTGVIWRMREDLSGPYPGFGLGSLDAFHGLVVYRLLDPAGLAPEIADLKALVETSYRALTITQDLGLGMMLWMSHFFPDEPWAVLQRARALAMLDRMWVDPPGYFCREPTHRQVKFAFTNYGISLGLQAVPAHGDRVQRLNAFFDSYRSGDEYDTNAITHVMACTSHFPGRFLRPAGAMG